MPVDPPPVSQPCEAVGAEEPLRLMAEQAFSRAAGAPLIPGNSVRLLRNAEQNYPAWMDALHSATSSIHFESYMIANDGVGRRFLELLTAKARAGVRVRLLYDWVGTSTLSTHRLRRSLEEAGGEVRCFNPPRLDSPLGWLSRDHRKMIVVDGQVGFVTGLCVSSKWEGEPRRGIEPWRDTGVEIRGPAVADICRAFAEVWSAAGGRVPEEEIPALDTIPLAGEIALRVIATAPNTAGLYRLDQLIAALARETLWLTDAYFVGMAPYLQALRAAAEDGVDVRLLVPGASDIPALKPLTRAGYRPLLEAGIRVFEWNGPMLHAKSAVADGHWARVGSTNLNIASWIGNYELDVAIEDEGFAEAMETMYQEDLSNSTEIVLTTGRKVRPEGKRKSGSLWTGRRRGGSSTRAAAGALRLANSIGAAMTNRRVLGATEARIMSFTGIVLLLLALICWSWPWLVSFPLAGILIWISLTLFVRSWRLRKERRKS